MRPRRPWWPGGPPPQRGPGGPGGPGDPLAIRRAGTGRPGTTGLTSADPADRAVRHPTSEDPAVLADPTSGDRADPVPRDFRGPGGPGGPPPGDFRRGPDNHDWRPPWNPGDNDWRGRFHGAPWGNDLPPWGWGAPPPPPWDGPLPEAWGPPPPPINYWGFQEQPVWDPGYNQWGFSFFGIWIPLPI